MKIHKLKKEQTEMRRSLTVVFAALAASVTAIKTSSEDSIAD